MSDLVKLRNIGKQKPEVNMEVKICEISALFQHYDKHVLNRVIIHVNNFLT